MSALGSQVSGSTNLDFRAAEPAKLAHPRAVVIFTCGHPEPLGESLSLGFSAPNAPIEARNPSGKNRHISMA